MSTGITREGYAAGQQVTKRLDVLGKLHAGFFGVSWWFVRVHLIAGGAWAMAGAHIMSFMYLTAPLMKEFPMGSDGRVFLTIGSVMVGAFVGSFVFGYLADARGRKFALLVAFALTTAADALCAASPSASVLTLFRLASGLGLGGLQPVVCTLIMELSPSNIRGRALVYLDAWYPVGAIFAMILSRELEPSIGWRAVMGLSGVGVLYMPLLYFCLPESPKWLATSGSIEEAVRVLRTIEQASSVFHGEEVDDGIKRLVQHAGVETASGTKQMIVQTNKSSFLELVTTRFRILMQFPYLSRTLMLWFVWTMMTLTNSAMCAYLDESFIGEVTDRADKTLLTYSVLIAQLLGNLFACALIDRIGRRYTVIMFVLLSSGGSLLEVYLERTVFLMTLSSCIRNFAFMAAWGCLFAYTPELYPTSLRVIGISYAWGISRLGFFAGPYVVIFITENLHVDNAGMTWLLFGLSLVVALATLVFGIETTNRDAESRSSTFSADRETDGSTAISYQKHEDGDEPPVMGSNPVHFI